MIKIKIEWWVVFFCLGLAVIIHGWPTWDFTRNEWFGDIFSGICTLITGLVAVFAAYKSIDTSKAQAVYPEAVRWLPQLGALIQLNADLREIIDNIKNRSDLEQPYKVWLAVLDGLIKNYDRVIDDEFIKKFNFFSEQKYILIIKNIISKEMYIEDEPSRKNNISILGDDISIDFALEECIQFLEALLSKSRIIDNRYEYFREIEKKFEG